MKKVTKLLMISLLGMILVTGCGKKEETITENDKIKINTSDNIEAKTYTSYNNEQLIIYVTNNNSYTIGSLDIEIRYYNDENQVVDEDATVIQNFKSGGKYVATMGFPYDDDLNIYVPEKMEINIKIDEEYQNEMEEKPNYIDQITTSYQEEEDEIKVTINNNSGKNLSEIFGVVVYKKNGVPIATSPFMGVDVDSSTVETVAIPTEWNQITNEDILIDFDDIEIIIDDIIDKYDENIIYEDEDEGEMQF